MKRILILMLLVLTGMSYISAENAEANAKRYEVANKKGKARFVPVEKEGDKWKYVQPREDIYLENGVLVEGFDIERNDELNYKGTPYISRGGLVITYEGKYYIDPFPDKDLKPINENGELSSGLGIRNYLSNTWLGDFYLTKIPGLIALACAIISGIFLLISIFKEKVPVFIRWAFAAPLCVIALLETGAAFSLGTDAAWWVNPDDVGYWVATPLLIPYAIVAAIMVYSYKFYGDLGHFDGISNVVVSTLLIIGIVLTVISAIFVVINFLFAACLLIFAGWMFKGIDTKDNGGNTINSGPLGTYKTDKYGNTTRID